MIIALRARLAIVTAALAVAAVSGQLVSAPNALADPDTTTAPTTTTPTTTPHPSADDASSTRSGPGQAPGAVYVSRPLPPARMVAGAADGNDFTYWSMGADQLAHLSSGVLMLPRGHAPRGGWPIIAWAHGSRGIADGCAPSMRPVKADTDEMKRWLARGYAVVSTDYVGVGTPGTPQYYDVDVTARNIIDAVRAARDISADLSRSWAVVGEAQGASAAIRLARVAPSLQGPKLDFRGAAATSIPAQMASVLGSLGPSSNSAPAGLTADILYALSAIRNARPNLDLNAYLTDTGRQWMAKAASLCAGDLVRQSDNLVLGSLFAKPLSGNTELTSLFTKALALPTNGFMRPVLMTQSLQDTSVVVPLSLQYLNAARADRRVDARTYLTLDPVRSTQLADDDAQAFIARIFR